MTQRVCCALLLAVALNAQERDAKDFRNKTIRLERVASARHSSARFGAGSAEIVTYDPLTRRMFTNNNDTNMVDVFDISNPAVPRQLTSIDVSQYGNPTSVAVNEGLLAVACQKGQERGNVVFYRTDGGFVKAIPAGALPDMVTFTPNGDYALVANEGEPSPDYKNDPEGTVSIIPLRDQENPGGRRRGPSQFSKPEKRGYDLIGLTEADVITADFRRFNGQNLPGVRIFGPNATFAQDVEPEYITVSADSKTAWVTLQEANAIAEIDISSGYVRAVFALGYKDHALPGNALDPSDRDNAIKIENWPLFGIYNPDAIASFQVNGHTLLLTSNEGDTRAFDAYNEEARVSTLNLDPRFLSSDLKMNDRLGRLTVSNHDGLVKGGCGGQDCFRSLYVFGGRSFSIWDSFDGSLVWDSGDRFEKTIAQALPANFNASHDNTNLDDRSDNKGPEPEAMAVATLMGSTYAFIANERIGGIFVFDVTDPTAPTMEQYFTWRNFGVPIQDERSGDLGPEGLKYIPADDSPTGDPLLLVANEISGNVGIMRIVIADK